MDKNTNKSANNEDQRSQPLNAKQQGATSRETKTKQMGMRPSDCKQQKKVDKPIFSSSNDKGSGISNEENPKLNRSVWNHKDYDNSDTMIESHSRLRPPLNISLNLSQPLSMLGPLVFKKFEYVQQNKRATVGGTLKKSNLPKVTEKLFNTFKTSGRTSVKIPFNNQHATFDFPGTSKKVNTTTPSNLVDPTLPGDDRVNSTVDRFSSGTIKAPAQEIAESKNDESAELATIAVESDFVMVSFCNTNNCFDTNVPCALSEEQLRLLHEALMDPTDADPNTYL